MPTIEEALAEFLAAERERSPEDLERTELALDDFMHFLESYGHQYVEGEVTGLESVGAPQDEEESFVSANPPELIPETISEFLYYWQIRKFLGDADDARAHGEVTERLLDWLASEGLVDPAEAREAADLARRASDEVPRAMELAELLYPLTMKGPTGPPSSEDEEIEDRLRIVRVEPGQLWLEQDVGPIAVPEQASRIARVGWEINVLASRRKGTWYISEIGNVHPSLAEDEDEVDWDIGGEG